VVGGGCNRALRQHLEGRQRPTPIAASLRLLQGVLRLNLDDKTNTPRPITFRLGTTQYTIKVGVEGGHARALREGGG